MNPDGVLEVVDQYNARESETKLAAAVPVDLDADGVIEIVLVESSGGSLQVLERRRGGVYRYVESVPVESSELMEAVVTDLTGNGNQDILLLGADDVWWLPVGANDLAHVTRFTYESDLRGVSYHLVAVGDLDSDGEQDILAIDSRDSRVLEVLTRAEDGGWTSAMNFTIFDVDPHYEGQRGASSEPREVLVTDLTGDGRDDIALLIHDRVLLYPQQ
jgi:hypothetical protein